MTMPNWTIDELLAEEPCDDYTRERIEELYGGKPSLTLLEILDHPHIPEVDKVGVACLDKNTTRCAAIEAIVTRSITNHALRCGIPAVELWAQKWLSGEDRSTHAAETAKRASWDDVQDAAWYAARAAQAVAWYAARAAAWYAARAAARGAVREAAGAARGVEFALQVQDFRDALVQGQEGEGDSNANI